MIGALRRRLRRRYWTRRLIHALEAADRVSAELRAPGPPLCRERVYALVWTRERFDTDHRVALYHLLGAPGPSSTRCGTCHGPVTLRPRASKLARLLGRLRRRPPRVSRWQGQCSWCGAREIVR